MKTKLFLLIFLTAMLFTGCQQSEASTEIPSAPEKMESESITETETVIPETVPATELQTELVTESDADKLIQTELITETDTEETLGTETETVTEAETIPEQEGQEKQYDIFYGILIDQDCSDFEEPPLHDLPCMLMDSCRASGYGLDIQQEDGSYLFYMFDENGQNLAWDYLIQTDRMDGLYVTVTGVWEDNVIKVITLEES